MTTDIDRRAFLKKAGLAAGAAAALYVVPTITTVNAKPAYAAATGVVVGNCYSVQVDACPYDADSDTTKVRFAICNNCGKDVSYIALEEFPDHPAVSPNEGQYAGPQLGGDWLVSHTNGDSGQPPFPSIKFESLGDHGFKDGACEYFTVYYGGDIRGSDLTIRVAGKHGPEIQDILKVRDWPTQQTLG